MTCEITHQLICLKAILVVKPGSQILKFSPGRDKTKERERGGEGGEKRNILTATTTYIIIKVLNTCKGSCVRLLLIRCSVKILKKTKIY